MKCTGCGMTIHPDNNGYCPYCGTPVPEAFAASHASKESASPTGADGSSVFEKSIGGVLEIYTNAGSAGSGFLISKEGYAITNTHVIVDSKNKPCSRLIVNLNQNKINAEVVMMGDDKGGRGNGIDLAIIKLSQVPAGAVALRFADSEKVKNGETVYAIGNSEGEGTCITRGIVSDRMRMFCGKRYIMTDCAINPGNSGGPLLNIRGEVIGVNVLARRIDNGLFEKAGFSVSADGMKYSIPANEAKQFAAKYLS